MQALSAIDAAFIAQAQHATQLAQAGQFAAARDALLVAGQMPVENWLTRFLKAHVLLATTGRWGDGWRLLEWRPRSSRRTGGCRVWDGVATGPVVVVEENGMGDGVLFARWLPWLSQVSGAPPIWFGRSALARWVTEAGAIFVPDTEPERLQGHAAIGVFSLPYLAGCRSPAELPPPFAPAALRARAAAERPADRPLRVGVCWQGDPKHPQDFERSLTAEQFAPVWAPLDGVEFVNLTHAVDVPSDAPYRRVDFADFYATGEAMAELDAVLTVDTCIAHLAGSLGTPTLVLTPTLQDWRYRWPGEAGSPFYESVHVLRRRHAHDVDIVMRARAALEKWSTAACGLQRTKCQSARNDP